MSLTDRLALPTRVAPRYTFTVSPMSGAVEPLPFSVTRTDGVSTLVLASLLSVPESEAAFSANAGAAGAVVSGLLLMTVWLDRLAKRLPATS